MRTRIALAAATAATFISSTVTVTQAAAQSLATGHHHIEATRAMSDAFAGHTRVALTAASVAADVGTVEVPGSTWVLAVVGLGVPPAEPAAVTPAPAPPPPTDANSTATADWECIRIHESGGQYSSPTAPSGAYGILDSTWLSLGYSGWPYEAPAATQNAAALRLYTMYGWQPWSTRTVCGL